MQNRNNRSDEVIDQVTTTFAERAKAARLAAGLTQQQLSDRLSNETPVKLDTSAITRIEAGDREPKLKDALAIAQVLGFGLDNLVPKANLSFYIEDVERLMKVGRAALVAMLGSVDPLIEFVQRNPDGSGDERLDDRIRNLAEKFSEGEARRIYAVTRNRTDQRYKRQLLRALTDKILVGADELPPVQERWFKDTADEGPKGKRRQGWIF